jgi:hypothetical protein
MEEQLVAYARIKSSRAVLYSRQIYAETIHQSRADAGLGNSMARFSFSGPAGFPPRSWRLGNGQTWRTILRPDSQPRALQMKETHFMSWNLKPTDRWAENCRFAVRAALFIDVLLVSLATIYLTAKMLWFLIRFLNRTVFASPW